MMQSIITASLCDSRSCNQTGGGEHLKSDIEDLLALLPPPSASASKVLADDDDDVGYDNNNRGRQRQRVAGSGGGTSRRKHHPTKHQHRKHHRVVLTTCFGLCNHSPNIQLKSSGGPPSSLRARRGKLVNDGGFRMRLEDVEDGKDSQSQREQQKMVTTTTTTTTEYDDMEATDTAMISNATISKVARAIGLLKHDTTAAASASSAVRALECQSQGNTFQRNGRYDDALECYLEGRRQALLLLWKMEEAGSSSIGHNKDDDDGNGGNHELKLQSLAINKLLSKMILSCSKTRIQLATELMVVMDDDVDDREGDEKKEEASSSKMMLQLAAGDAFCVLLKSLKEEEEKEDGGDANKNGTTTEATTRRSSLSGDETNDGTVDVQSIIFEMVHSSTAGLQTRKFISYYEGWVVRGSARNTHHSRGEEDEEERSFAVPSLFRDIAIMVQFCVVLADAWKGLALAATRRIRTSDNNVTDDGDDAARAFANGALVAYKGALDIASASKGRVLRAKERRRIDKAMAALVFCYN